MKKFLYVLLAFMCLIPTVALAGCTNDKDPAKNVANRIYYIKSSKEDLIDTTQTYNEGAIKLYFYNSTFKLEFTDKNNQSVYGYYTGEYEADDNIVELDIENKDGCFLTLASSFDIKKLNFDNLVYEKGNLKFEDIVDKKIVQFVFEEVSLNS